MKPQQLLWCSAVGDSMVDLGDGSGYEAYHDLDRKAVPEES